MHSDLPSNHDYLLKKLEACNWILAIILAVVIGCLPSGFRARWCTLNSVAIL